MTLTNILDSSLITPTKSLIKYNCKIIQCGDYIQLFYYSTDKLKSNDNDYSTLLKTLKRDLIINDSNVDLNLTLKDSSNIDKFIDIKNINRSKINCQLLAKANIDSWKTFITLTYADNYTDIESSRKHFQYFIDSIRRRFKNLKYLCITEFQKRGAIHYHLLTNISLDSSLIYFQIDNNNNKKFPHIKYWSYGFNSVEEIKGDYKKIIGYISKYMTKDIDNRLYSKRRYLYSQNLNKPFVNYVNLENKLSVSSITKYLSPSHSLTYHNIYFDKITNQPIHFYELRLDSSSP